MQIFNDRKKVPIMFPLATSTGQQASWTLHSVPASCL